MKRARLAEAGGVRNPTRPHPPWPGIEHQLSRRRLFIRHTPPTAPNAEPAVFVHGLGGSAQNWTDLADALSDRLAVDAVDLPGFGQSAPAPRVTIPLLAQDVAAWIVESGRGPVHLAGHSLGGAVSVYLAATRPGLVRTLTLVSPAMPFANPRRSHQSRFVPMLAVPNMARIADRLMRGRTPEQVVNDIYLGTWADPTRVHPQRRREAISEARRRLAVPWNSSAYIQTYRGLMASFFQSFVPGTHSLWRLAKKIACPTLVIWGKQDKVIDVRLAPPTALAIPDSRLLILNRTGHVAMMEHPHTVARAMVALLDDASEVEPDTADDALSVM
ncbi:alpha/beta fold hydrolase [Glycomyces sp. TRM65418]|uniref:alpha/beta fold hydrolase n=1 Tax=Glycomyces sp. TRM65418 TaxID=2867006 RepID=UPI001CE4CE78|nr:alpha/beta fold hydrolase [Glycomyces sp. TRM65418]MCC3762864.1 alpha/beta fold hydrolase [Glycomyces sp. TRM65418]QZD56891.1 alpha/beta fold hydrolase [Glycomyces sp. TRM65418]